ncbi:MAG: hypothetical protein DYH20_16150 [Gammaproteobacteria bacterium PRO9]|nr:hypothetical protein [Gammaproteobacteria bacterium PRO9]
MEFSGTPRKYLRFSIIASIVFNLYLYLGLGAIEYWANGSTWVFGWKPLLITVAMTVFFARLSYRWMMRLDARYGTGRGWVLESRQLKLPERAIRRRP